MAYRDGIPNDCLIGIVGGSGFYDMPGIENKEEVAIETPYGSPSDAYKVLYEEDSL